MLNQYENIVAFGKNLSSLGYKIKNIACKLFHMFSVNSSQINKINTKQHLVEGETGYEIEERRDVMNMNVTYITNLRIDYENNNLPYVRNK